MLHDSPATFGPDALAHESRRRRWVYLALALLLTLGYLAALDAYWTPAHGGVDQNGYLVGGKQLAKHGSMALVPRDGAGNLDPYQFVGRMWIGADLGTPDERYYPKYPIGLPLLYAGALRVGGETWGPWLVYRVSPVAMTLAMLGVFLLARPVVGSLAGLLTAIVVAVSPVTLSLANNPNSHAATLAFVTWGMVLLFAWWRRGKTGAMMGGADEGLMGGWWGVWWRLWGGRWGVWRPGLAGFLLGCAVAIRYTEGLLVVPMLLIALFNFAPRRLGSWMAILALLAGWALPVGLLLAHNRNAFSAWTGYDPTNESSGFAWVYFVDNWRTMLSQLHDTGLAFVFPLAAAGLVGMFALRWRLALVLTAWVVPNLLVYTFYYWAPDRGGLNVGYLRFFLTAFPPLALAAFWLLGRVAMAIPQANDAMAGKDGAAPGAAVLPPRRWAVVTLGSVALLAILMNLPRGLEMLDRELPGRLALDASATQVLRSVPAGAVVMTQNTQLLHHLQFVGEYELYNLSEFSTRELARLRQIDPDEPQGLQPQRAQMLADRLENMDDRQRAMQQQNVVNVALASGRRVFCLAMERQEVQIQRAFPARDYALARVDSWTNPLASSQAPPTGGRGAPVAMGPRPGGPGGPAGAPPINARPTPRRQPLPPVRFNTRDWSWQAIEIKANG